MTASLLVVCINDGLSFLDAQNLQEHPEWLAQLEAMLRRGRKARAPAVLGVVLWYGNVMVTQQNEVKIANSTLKIAAGGDAPARTQATHPRASHFCTILKTLEVLKGSSLKPPCLAFRNRWEDSKWFRRSRSF